MKGSVKKVVDRKCVEKGGGEGVGSLSKAGKIRLVHQGEGNATWGSKFRQKLRNMDEIFSSFESVFCVCVCSLRYT